MSIAKYLWIGCGILWAFIIIGFIALTLFNRRRNRDHREDE